MSSNVAGPRWAPREFLDQIARRSPARLTITVFAGVIIVFTALLSTPMATTSGQRAPLVDALFTATSAVCVTGLVTVNTAVFWSGFGQAVILLGIQVGGLGVMTLASILGMAVSRRIGLTQKLLTASETKTTRLGEVGSLVRVVIITSVTLEAIIAVLIFPRLLALQESVGHALWQSVFYSISAFNNAGFNPTEHGLLEHTGDWFLCLPIILGVFIGSLGFPVILNIARRHKRPRTWSLHSKLTLATSTILVGIGTLLFAALEWRNSETLGPLSFPSKILASLLAGVMPRSGGFSSLDVNEMHESTWLINDALMFVGGGSASTAGGIKVTTLAVMVLAIVSEARGDRDVEAFGRRIPRDTLRLAVAVSFIGASIVLVASLALLSITGLTLDVVLFEVISAFGTVGLSTGITGDLPNSGKYVLIAVMFVGRTGTMSLAAALALRDRRRVVRFPEERPIIG